MRSRFRVEKGKLPETSSLDLEKDTDKKGYWRTVGPWFFIFCCFFVAFGFLFSIQWFHFNDFKLRKTDEDFGPQTHDVVSNIDVGVMSRFFTDTDNKDDVLIDLGDMEEESSFGLSSSLSLNQNELTERLNANQRSSGADDLYLIKDEQEEGNTESVEIQLIDDDQSQDQHVGVGVGVAADNVNNILNDDQTETRRTRSSIGDQLEGNLHNIESNLQLLEHNLDHVKRQDEHLDFEAKEKIYRKRSEQESRNGDSDAIVKTEMDGFMPTDLASEGDSMDNIKAEDYFPAPVQESVDSTSPDESNSFGNPSFVISLEDGLGGEFDGTTVRLQKQIDLPENGKALFQNANVDKNFWPVHKALRKHGWVWAQKSSPGKVHMMFTKGKIPNFFKSGKQMLNSMGLSGCIGGSKSLQLQCRERLAEKSGCSYADLGIQPAQYPMDSRTSCMSFFDRANKEENLEKLWLYKPANTYHGAGIELYRGPAKLWKKFDKCNKKSLKKGIMMEYISKPATIKGGYKFDFRTYLLVGSLQPQLVFFHDGFIRKSDTKYSEHSTNKNTHVTNAVSQSSKDHFFNFTYLNHALHSEMDFPLEYIARAREYLKKVTLFMFHTARVQPQPLGRIKGRWHIFGVDWMIDQYGHIHLLEGNGYPLVSHYPGIGLTPRVWQEMTDLILDIHTNPSSLNSRFTVKSNYKYGGWTLIFNELEEAYNLKNGQGYNPCNVFPQEV